MKLLIGVCTHQGAKARESACRQTWVHAAAALPQTQILFFSGGTGDDRLEGDHLHLAAEDDYIHLPQKVGRFYRWACDHLQFDYLFKCDDDTYVCVDRLLANLPAVDYAGFNYGGRGQASGGAGYLLSRQAALLASEVEKRNPTGDEDVAVGLLLNREGITLRELAGLSPSNHNPPHANNQQITAHYVSPDQMHRIHEAFHMPHQSRQFFCLNPAPVSLGKVSGTVAWGEIGINGALGFKAEGQGRVRTPGDHHDWTQYATISAHAPSQLTIDIEQPLAICGFLDQAATLHTNAVTFRVDGQVLGQVGLAGDRTREVLLQPGTHQLEAAITGNNGRRYSVWALRPWVPTSYRIVIPTSNKYTQYCDTTLALLDNYWPDHPPVDVVHHEKTPKHSSIDRVVYAGPQEHVSWCQALTGYLEQCNREDLVMLMLDDYALCGTPQRDKLQQAVQTMGGDPSIAAIYLTWMYLPENVEKARLDNGLIRWPKWTWSVHTQAGLWRRDSLLRMVKEIGPASPDAFELDGSDNFNKRHSRYETLLGFDLPDPPVKDLFLDRTDKTHWILPYHNLMHRGRRRKDHDPFLRDHGLDWLLSST